MCLVKRKETCKFCFGIHLSEILIEALDDNINDVSDGHYLKMMNEAKLNYEEGQALHKRFGCIDHDLKPDPPPEDEDDEVEVEEFYWQDVLYYKTTETRDGRYVLYLPDRLVAPLEAGTITNGLVEIW